jgi:hypothetical protein
MPLKDALTVYLMGGLEWGKTSIGLVRFFGRAAYQGNSNLTERMVRPIADVMRGNIQEILKQAQARGEFPQSTNVDEATRIVNTLLIAISDSQLLPYLNVYFQVADDAVSSERVMAALIEFILRGLGAYTK